MKNSKTYIKIAGFLVICIAIFILLSQMIITNGLSIEQYDSFVKLPKNSVDVLISGGSYAYAGISPMAIWEQNGITVQNGADSMQAPHLTYTRIADALKRQNIKTVIIDPTYLFVNYNFDKREKDLHTALDPMPLSLLKIQAAAKIESGSKKLDMVQFLFPFFRHHNKWDALLQPEIFSETKHDYLHGQNVSKNRENRNGAQKSDEYKIPKYDIENLAEYERAIKLCLDKGIKVILLTMPGEFWDEQKHIWTQTIAYKYGIEYIDLNDEDILKIVGLDDNYDYSGNDFLNADGAIKISQYLGSILSEKYGMPDRRMEKSVAQMWDNDLDKYNQFIEEWRNRQ